MAYFCQCGCGKEIPPSYLHGRRYEPKYLSGHNSKTKGFAAQMAQAKARRGLTTPTLICQCGCGEVIPPKENHRYRPAKYIQSHYLKLGTHLRIERLREAKADARLAPPNGWAPPSGLCGCGCGKPTKIVETSRAKFGEYAGYPARFLHGHHGRLMVRERASGWRGGRCILRSGYVALLMPEYPGSNSQGYVLEHRYVYEKSRGVTLPKDAQVHHINGDRTDNRPENLIAMSRLEHRKAHQIANELIALFLDDRLLDAARRIVRETGAIPDLEALTAQVYGVAGES